MSNNHLTIAPTRKTPMIVMEPGRILIAGRSIPENSFIFYQPLYDKISEYLNSYSGKTEINLAFEFINTTSIRWIYTILSKISITANIQSGPVNVTWFYEEGDEDMFDLGQIIAGLLKCPFQITEVDAIEKCFPGYNF